MAEYDLQIKGGTVVDGTRVPRYRADLWIKNGTIAQIGGRAPGFAKRVIDAAGSSAPGDTDRSPLTEWRPLPRARRPGPLPGSFCAPAGHEWS